jgi:hypothetical protein
MSCSKNLCRPKIVNPEKPTNNPENEENNLQDIKNGLPIRRTYDQDEAF